MHLLLAALLTAGPGASLNLDEALAARASCTGFRRASRRGR
jgi:hypothetical protein